MTEMDAIREEIRQLHLKHSRGDIREKSFQQLLAQRTMDLYRAAVEESLGKGERILHEHHVIQAHMRLSESILKEPEQKTVGLFLTDRGLLRVRSSVVPGRPVTCDERDGTRLDRIPLDRIEALTARRQIRPGQIWVGLAILAIGGLFYSWLSITGPVLVALGALGALHGLVLPTRWMEVQARGIKEPFVVYALRKKSAKVLLARLGKRLPGPSIQRGAREAPGAA
jgi:hypothetical protein